MFLQKSQNYSQTPFFRMKIEELSRALNLAQCQIKVKLRLIIIDIILENFHPITAYNCYLQIYLIMHYFPKAFE